MEEAEEQFDSFGKPEEVKVEEKYAVNESLDKIQPAGFEEMGASQVPLVGGENGANLQPEEEEKEARRETPGEPNEEK